MTKPRTPEILPDEPKQKPLEDFKQQQNTLENMRPGDSTFDDQLTRTRATAEVLDERLLDDLAQRLEQDPRIRQEMAKRGLKFWNQIDHAPDGEVEKPTMV
jgi:hypothetical protein